MTSGQRRNTFRLPWLSDAEEADGPAAPAAPPEEPAEPANDTAPSTQAASHAAPSRPSETVDPAAIVPETDHGSAGEGPEPAPDDQPPTELLSDLVAAMRGVADHARATTLAELRERLDAHLDRLRADSETRASDLRKRADTDVTGIGEWARAEAERIKAEAERRVATRRQELDQQLVSETKRAEQEMDATRNRVASYERELDAFFTQLSEINDPSAFAAAVKRMPRAPQVGGAAPSALEAAPTAVTPDALPTEAGGTPAPATPATHGNGAAPVVAEQASSDAQLSERLAELDSELAGGTAAPPEAPSGGTTTSTIVVQGLRSFGAITAFKQALAGAAGIEAVNLSLGPSGEFLYRATHHESLDVEARIVELEGGKATVARQADGTLRVTVERSR